ncbi:PREDICTED: putative F-box protein At1g33020 [Camelina sativa]|uniref:F-box protein At1g33020 n=1 Tax=Camelina sativa TaxID=90675 RepID=A0ABM0YG96_CAMSA|nr:PREDICTED: putative F-box protein At1g33020 [Camelina sativa]
MLRRPYFSKLFLTRSSVRPRLLFAVAVAVKRGSKLLFFSSPQPQNSYERSSLVVRAELHSTFSENTSVRYSCRYSSGLIHFSRGRSNEVICNPITGQYTILPELKTCGPIRRCFLGFDPIDMQHKVLLADSTDYYETVHYVMTLGTQNMTWRKIQCPFSYTVGYEGICINGVYYYLVKRSDDYATPGIVCFDVRSEKFKFIENVFCYGKQLMNYKGKLAAISLWYRESGGRLDLELRTWVLEDVEKQEWSESFYSLWSSNLPNSYTFSVVGVTATGEIVLSKKNTSKRFHVLYFNPQRNTLQHVGVHCNHEAMENSNTVLYTFVDHVEDLKLNNLLTTTCAATSISPPEQNCKPTSSISTSYREKDHEVMMIVADHPQQDPGSFESINKFEALRLLDDDEFTGIKTCECDTSHLQVSCKLLSLCCLVSLFFLVIYICLNFVTRILGIN